MITIAPYFFHYISIAICTVLTSLGVTIGQSKTTKAAFDALDRQPKAKEDIQRATILSLAIIETGGLLGFLGSIFLFMEKNITLYNSLSQIGFAVAIAVPGFVIGIASAFPAQSALMSIARQPFFSKKILNFMLLTQSLIQTPLAFGFVIAMIIKTYFSSPLDLNGAFALVASGTCVGLSSIGPAIGIANFTFSACKSIGTNKSSYDKLFSFTIISQAIIETPVIFGVIISLWLSRFALVQAPEYTYLMYLSIAMVMTIGTLSPGLSSGRIASEAANQIAISPKAYGNIARTSMIAQGIIDTSAIYAFIIAISLILALG